MIRTHIAIVQFAKDPYELNIEPYKIISYALKGEVKSNQQM